MKINVISETEFTVKGHGVHTAYIELTTALKARDDADVTVNARNSSDIVHLHTIGIYALFFLLFSRGKKVVSAHVVPDSFVGSIVGAKYWLPIMKLYLRWLYNRADLVLAVSDETRRQLLSLGVKKPIEIFYNVIDTSRYHNSPDLKNAARENLGIAPDAWVVIGAGQVQPRKRVDSFISGAKALPHVTYYWVGGMPFGKIAANNADMQRMIDTAPENMHFVGIVPLEEMKQYYQAADVFFLPSAQETFGLVVVEGAAAGLPVMLRDIEDYDETFRDYSIMADEAGFVAGVEKLRIDTVYYRQMSEQALKLAEKYDATRGAARLMDLYRKLI